MDEAAAWQRVGKARVGRLATVTADGRPHLVPCCFALSPPGVPGPGLASPTVYSAVDAKPKSTLALRRLDNVRANPSASLLVDHYDDDWSTLWWVRLDGTARVVEAGEERSRALALLVARYEQYRDQPPPGAVLAIDVTGWRAWP